MGCSQGKQHEKPDYNVNQRDVDAKELSLADIKPYESLNDKFVFLSRKTGWEVFEVRLLYAAYLEYAQPKSQTVDVSKLRIADKKAFRPLFERCCWSLFQTWDNSTQGDPPTYDTLATKRLPSPDDEKFARMSDAAFVHFDRKHKGVDFVDFIVALHLLCRSEEREQTDFLHSIYSLNDIFLKAADIEYFLKTIRRPQQRANFPEPSHSVPDGGMEGSRMSSNEVEELEHEAMLLVKQLQRRSNPSNEALFSRLIDDLNAGMEVDDSTRRIRRELLQLCLRANRMLFGTQEDSSSASISVPMEAGEPRALDNIWEYRSTSLRALCRAKNGRLSADAFAAWGSHHLDLRKKQLFAGFEMFPTANDEELVYKLWQGSQLGEIGESWFVVEQKWWDNWCAYIGIDTESNRHAERTRPMQINNEDILDRALSRDGINVLRPPTAISEDIHFQLVNEKVWNQLEAWYGCERPVRRFIVERGVQRKQRNVDLYPLFVRLVRANKSKSTQNEIRSYPTFLTPKAVHEQISKEEKIPKEDMRLWAGNDGEQVRLLYPVDAHDNETLNSIEWISSGVQVLIDQKRAGEWQVEDPMKKWKPWQTKVANGEWEVDQRLDARDSNNNYWYPGRVIGRRDDGDSTDLKIKYDNYNDKYNEWISVGAVCTGCYVNGKCDDIAHRIAPVNSLNKASQKRNRTSSANRSRSRSGSDTLGLVGLSNLGNTCFMNSTLQCMSNTKIFREHFLSRKYEEHLNRSNVLGTGGKLASSFAALLNAMWDGKRRVFAPKHFKRTIGDFAPNFEGYQQQDSQELLQYLLDGIHEDLNRIKKKVPTEKVEYDAGQKEDWQIAEECWNRYLIRNKSIVVDLFTSMYKSHVKCPECQRSSITFEPYMYLQLPIPGHASKSIEVKLFRLKHPDDPNRDNTPCRYRVTVPQHTNFNDLKKELEAISGVRANQMLVADIWQKKIYKMHRGRSYVSTVRADDITHVYEMDLLRERYTKANKPDSARRGYIYHLSKSPERARSQKQWALFGNPFVFLYWNMSTCTEIHERIFQLLSLWYPGLFDKHSLDDLPYKVWLTDEKGSTLTYMPVCEKTIKADREIQITFLIEWNKAYLDDVQEQMKMERSDPRGSMVKGGKRKGGISLLDCFDEYTKAETLDSNNMWYCNKCKDHYRATKKIDIWDYPEYLILHLKRFRQSGRGRRDKISALVDFPLSGLNLDRHCLKAQSERADKRGSKPIYDCFAVSNHSGGLGGGHYTAYAKNSMDHKWYYFNDRSVSPVDSTSSIISPRAYVLFYQRRR